MTGDATLHGYGRLDWDTARTLLDDCWCAWTDLDGIQLADRPSQHMPIGATHLWGWSADRLVRLRFDTGPGVEASGNAGAVYAATLTFSAIRRKRRVPCSLSRSQS